ncbi:LptF/LptG family permease [Coprobacter sp.]
MFRIKRLYLFILQTFLPLFLMTFFICLFIILMQFLWRYVDELVGKGIEMPVLAELFFYAAVSMVPMSLPLALLLASLMTFGNLGERLELLAIKAAGVSLLHIMRPLVIVIAMIAVGAFFFQNDILPKAQVKMYTLLYSIRQKSPELDIPEGVFYDQINGYNLYVKEKDRKTGMMRDLMIYDLSEGFDNAMVILADSGKLKLTEDKQYLFLTLFSGESFENLKNQRTAVNSVPYRRETFSTKVILIPFDAGFNRMDDGVMQNQYIGKDMHELRTSIDSMTTRIDSIGNVFGNELKNSGYFTLYNNERPDTTDNTKKSPITIINIDSIYASASLQQRESMLNRAVSRAETVRQDYEYKSMLSDGDQRIIRRHEMEMHKKFTLSFACLIFFFIGAPLGAIIRKGGLGTPVVVSVLLFIFYYIIDNSGYKMARDGRWEVWEGMWLSSAVLLPLGIFLTYKAVNDADVFNKDLYTNFIRKLIGKKETRHITMKEVIIDEVDITEAEKRIEQIRILCDQMQKNTGKKRQSYWEYWTKGYDKNLLRALKTEVDGWVEYAQNTRSQTLISKLTNYPVLRMLLLYQPCHIRWIGITMTVLFPISVPIYFIGNWEQSRLRRELQTIQNINIEILTIIRETESEKINK